VPTSGNVIALIPVLTPITPTPDQFDLLYPYALDEFEGDDPGCSETGAERALAYLVAHYLAGGQGQVGLQGEKIDDYSYTLSGVAAGTSRWYAMYLQQLGRCREMQAVSASALAGTRHEDAAGLKDLHLDQNPIVSVNEEDHG
jgi:hypothetical protein